MKINIMALGAATSLLVTASGQAQVLFVSSSQNYIYDLSPGGTIGTFDNLITSPSQMAFNSSGNLFVASDGSIIEITPAGVTSTFATGISDVGGMAFNNAGDLFVSDFGTGIITEITPAGTKGMYSSGLDDPRGLAFSSQRILYVGTATNIATIGANGAAYNFAEVSGGVSSLAFNDNFDLYAGSGKNLLEFTPNGTESTFASLPLNTGDQIEEIAFNGVGNLFVADGTGGGVLEYAPNGTESSYGSIFGQANGLAFAAPEPRVWGLLAAGVVVLLPRTYQRKNGGHAGRSKD